MPGEREEPLARVGRYELAGELGRGAMGVVYRAVDPELGRPVAIKVLSGGARGGEERVERFRREARAAARIAHPNVVRVHDVGTWLGAPWFAMDLVEGDSLSARIPEGGVADPRSGAALMAKVARAVHHLHGEGIVHRDLKPSNILVDAAGEPHVTDLGLAADLRDRRELTQAGAVLGTPAYMSPEQCRASRDVDARADVWALGAVLHQVLTGRPPFGGETDTEVLRAVLQDDPPPVRRLRPGLPRDAGSVVDRALEKEPARRYPDALALAEDMERLARGDPVQARPRGPIARAARRVARRPRTVLAATLAAALLGASAWGLHRQARHEEARSAVVEGRSQLLAGRPDEAVGTAGRALDAAPGLPEALALRAEAHAAAGRHELSLGDLGPLLPADADGRLHLALSTSLRALGRLDEAEEARREARVRAGPAAFDAATAELRGEARAALQERRAVDARSLAERLIEREPEDVEARAICTRAILAGEGGDKVRARAALGHARVVAAARPEDPSAALHLGICLVYTGEPVEGRDGLRRAYDLDPERMGGWDGFFYHYNHSVMYSFEGAEDRDARKVPLFEWAIAHNRTNSTHNRTWSHLHLAHSLRRLGRLDEALEQFRRAEEGDDPGYAFFVHKEEGDHWRELGDPGRARELYQRVVDRTAGLPEGTLEESWHREALRAMEALPDAPGR
ncbi:MAG: protein kinase [Planctomycetes bacterium]|nr:protein kinase [Planctomycetota bacterium]